MRKGTIIKLLTGSLLIAGCAGAPAPSVNEKELYRIGENITRDQIRRRIETIERILSNRPGEWQLHYLLASYFRKMGTPYYRALAVRELNRAIKLNGSDPELYMERGRINRERRFYGDAEGSFRKALMIDPDNYEAYCQLGEMKKKQYTRSMCFREYAEDACELFRKASRADPAGRKALVELTSLYLLLNSPDSARTYALMLDAETQGPAVRHTLLGIINLRTADFTAAEREFARSLELMSASEKKYYRDISSLLEPDERKRYLALPPGWKERYLRNFWIDRDPTPATDINERLLEHYRRVYFARYLFRSDRLGYEGPETDRGRSLIRYGFPDRIEIPFDQGSIKPDDASVIAWSYRNSQPSFTLYFMDEFLNGDYHIPVFRRYCKYSHTNLAVEDAVPERYSYPLEFRSIRIYSQVVQRRSTGGTELYFSTSLPEEELAGSTGPCRAFFSIRDAGRNLIYSRELSFSADSLINIRKYGREYLILRHAATLLPRTGESVYHVTLLDSSVGKRGRSSGQLSFIDFSTGRLNISDISLSLPLRATSCRLFPDGRSVFPAGLPICLSYEIYNLSLNRRREAEYTLTYTIIPGQPTEGAGLLSSLTETVKNISGSESQSFISNSITLNSYSSQVKDRLIIDTGGLEEGRYIIRLEITDLADSCRAERERNFVIR